MLTRQFEIRNVDHEARTVSGIAVPFNDVIEVGGIREKFIPGAIESIENVKLYYAHTEPIGRITHGMDTDAGYEITAQISETQRGNEVYTLLKDGVLNKFSVGFEPIRDSQDENVIVREKVRLREVSVVAFPAYENANVQEVREMNTESDVRENSDEIKNKEKTQMTDTDVNSEMSVLRDSVSDLERRFETLGSAKPEARSTKYTSYGDFIKGAVRGEDEAVALYRTYTGGTTADAVVKAPWVGSVIDLLDKPRRIINAFSKRPLPSEGLQVEYAVLDANTVDVAVQAAEGDTLEFGKVSIDTANATVKTYGGYSSLSRQEIERSSHVSILQTTFEALVSKYAAATNAAAQTALLATLGVSAQEVEYTAGGLSVVKVLGAVVDTAGTLDDFNLNLDGFLVSLDTFKTLASLVDSANRPLVAAANPSNNLGGANLRGLTGEISGVPLVAIPTLPNGTWLGVDTSAVVTYESPGVPFRLTDGDITSLVNHYSVYGYMATAIEKPKGIVEIKVAS